jgi:hypothetical protein
MKYFSAECYSIPDRALLNVQIPQHHPLKFLMKRDGDDNDVLIE